MPHSNLKRVIMKGLKDSQDKKYGLECKCGIKHTPSYEDLAWIIINCMNNEDILYPPNEILKGGRMLHEYFLESMIYRKLPDKGKYHL
jgi:hypothetical protein